MKVVYAHVRIRMFTITDTSYTPSHIPEPKFHPDKRTYVPIINNTVKP